MSFKQKEAVLDFFHNESCRQLVFDGVETVLKYLKDKDYEIGIFSEGVPEFQRTKLKNIQIDKYLNKDLIFITKHKRSDKYLDKLPRGCFVVDDNPDVINALTKNGSFKPIHILTGYKFKKIELTKKPFATIKKLEELTRIL